MYLYTMYIQKHCVHTFRFGVPGTLHIGDEQRSYRDHFNSIISLCHIKSQDEAVELLLDSALRALIEGEELKKLWNDRQFIDCLFNMDSEYGPVCNQYTATKTM